VGWGAGNQSSDSSRGEGDTRFQAKDPQGFEVNRVAVAGSLSMCHITDGRGKAPIFVEWERKGNRGSCIGWVGNTPWKNCQVQRSSRSFL